MANNVSAVPAAPRSEAISDFAQEFRFETDCWDVHEALKSQEPGFVLLGTRRPLSLLAVGGLPPERCRTRTATSSPESRADTARASLGLPVRDASAAPARVEERVNAIRAFNRFWAEQSILLQAGLRRAPYSLPEARVLFELAQRDVTQVVDLRRDLQLTGGYVSRILAKLRSSQLVTTESSARSARRQVVRLTSRGWSAVQGLDQQWSQSIRAQLAKISEARQRRLIAAMVSIQQVLEGPSSRRMASVNGRRKRLR